jgi:hypothetical protein
VLATLSKSHSERLLAEGESLGAALLGGYQLAFGLGAALVLIAIVIGLTVLRRPAAVEAGRPLNHPSPAAPDLCDCWAA